MARLFSQSRSDLKQRIRASLALARYRNSVDSETWGVADDWAATTTYRPGTVVKSGGFLYLMFGNSGTGSGQSGTSGSSNPFNANPYSSGQNIGFIADGTCEWLFYGVANGLSTTPLISTMVPAAASDAMTGFFAIVANSALSTLGLTQGIDPVSANNVNGQVFWYTGGPYDATNADVLGPNAGTVASPNYAASQKRPAVEFETDARWVGFQPSGPIYSDSNHLFEVNGRMLTPSPVLPGVQSNSSSYLLDLSGFGPGVKRVRVYGYQSIRNDLLYRLWVAPTDTVYAPSNPFRFSIAFEGDSITQGGNSSPLFRGIDMAAMTARRLGCDHWYNNAEGGTGFIADSSGTKTKYADRLDRLVQFNPDILVIGGNHNDVTAGTSAQRQAAILSYLQQVRSHLPNTTIFASGGHLLQSESATGTDQLALENDMKAAVSSFNDSNCHFVPVLTDPAGSWITGTGTGNSPQNNGNKDRFYWKLASVFTDAHPLPAFYEYISRRYANVIDSWAQS